LLDAIKSDDFTFLGSLASEEEKSHPVNDVERIAFTTALDSVIWSNKEDPGYFAKLVFPKCFELSGIALILTSKFGGLKFEEK